MTNAEMQALFNSHGRVKLTFGVPEGYTVKEALASLSPVTIEVAGRPLDYFLPLEVVHAQLLRSPLRPAEHSWDGTQFSWVWRR